MVRHTPLLQEPASRPSQQVPPTAVSVVTARLRLRQRHTLDTTAAHLD